MAQEELDEINHEINMSDEDYFEKHLVSRNGNMLHVLNGAKTDAEADVKSLTALGVKFGLVEPQIKV